MPRTERHLLANQEPLVQGVIQGGERAGSRAWCRSAYWVGSSHVIELEKSLPIDKPMRGPLAASHIVGIRIIRMLISKTNAKNSLPSAGPKFAR